MYKYLIILFLASCTLQLFSQENSKAIFFIVDASGSMWEKNGKDTRINQAREVLGEMVSSLPEDQKVGLMVYGHRKKGDCSDIEELIPIDNTDKEAFIEAIGSLNPTGKTPLAATARKVIEQLRVQQQSATIILITDGIESCGGDLCEVVKAAKKAGIEFIMHIVGFDLGKADRKPLECAARNADGNYMDANNKEELAEAIRQSSKITIDTPPGKLSVQCSRNGELIDASIRVFKGGTREEVAFSRSYDHIETNPALIHVPTGNYDLLISVIGERGIPPLLLENININDSVVSRQYADFSSGYLSLTISANGQLHDATVNFRPHQERNSISTTRSYSSPASNPVIKELAPGNYDLDIGSVSIKGNLAKTSLEKVVIRTGDTTYITHDFKNAILTVSTLFLDKLCDGTIHIIDKESGRAIVSRRTYAYENGNPTSFVLSPGEYFIRAKGIKVPGDPNETRELSLSAGEQKEINFKWN